MPPAKIREASDRADHFPKLIRPFPGYRPCANPARTGAADRMPFWVFGQMVLFLNFRQNFLQQESRITIAQRIVFKAPVARRRIWCAIPFDAWLLAGFRRKI